MTVMKNELLGKVWILFFSASLVVPGISLAEHEIQIEPHISVSQVYDNNIYLDSENEKSDSITTVSPGIDLGISSSRSLLSISYTPTWVRFHEYDQNNTVRQSGTLTYHHNVAEHMQFDLLNTYIKSEEALEEEGELERARDTRDVSQRNRGSVGFNYQFGREDELSFGYTHLYVKNEDVSMDDGTTQNPYASLRYWLNEGNGLECNYGYTNAIFWRDDDSQSGDDYAGHVAGLGYIHRFSPHTSASIDYEFTGREFEGITEDYAVHEESIGVDHSFSSTLSLSLRAGIFNQRNDRSEDERGHSYDASFEKRFDKASFSLGGRGGWDEIYLGAERRGFIRYWSATTRLEYHLMEPLHGYVSGSYRREKDSMDQERDAWNGSVGLRHDFLRWFSLLFDYSYRSRDDDDNTFNYSDNRITLTVTTRRPWRW